MGGKTKIMTLDFEAMEHRLLAYMNLRSAVPSDFLGLPVRVLRRPVHGLTHIIDDVWLWDPDPASKKGIVWWRRHTEEQLKNAIATMFMRGVSAKDLFLVRSFKLKGE